MDGMAGDGGADACSVSKVGAEVAGSVVKTVRPMDGLDAA